MSFSRAAGAEFPMLKNSGATINQHVGLAKEVPRGDQLGSGELHFGHSVFHPYKLLAGAIH